MSPDVLLSGIVGALLVFGLGIAREWWRNEQERRSLLRLLLAEIKHNGEVLFTVSERLRDQAPVADLIGHPNFRALKTRTWSDVQGRAAMLLPNDLMTRLDGYYSPLETLLTLASFTNMVGDSFDRTLRAQIQESKPEWSVAVTRNPYQEQLQQLLDAQECVPTKIEEYLARPRWGTLFLWADRWAQRRGQG